MNHLQRMPHDADGERTRQRTPSQIPALRVDDDATGQIATYQPGGPTDTAKNAFFRELGTNGRTCFTCHQPQNGWSISAENARQRFDATGGMDPLFRPVDGANCPTADRSSLQARVAASSLLLAKGLIRVGLAVPMDSEFAITHIDDPYGCNLDPATGLTSPTSGIASVYRRPLPSANLGFLSAIMWDGREPDLAHQARDATLGHAQAAVTPMTSEQDEIVSFESGLFVAQSFDDRAHALDAGGAEGGPAAVARVAADFFIGVNDPLGQNPTGAPFDSEVFNLYEAWEATPGNGDEAQQRRSIARGERLFNTRPIDIAGVAGLNDMLGVATVSGFCSTCHDTPSAGNHSVKLPLNIGVADAGTDRPPGLDISDLPVFTLECRSGPLAGRSFAVTDPGRALISGKCQDIGKVKGPILRTLSARAPYFHNGAAATLADVVEFYDLRFHMGLSEDDKEDLINFLSAL